MRPGALSPREKKKTKKGPPGGPLPPPAGFWKFNPDIIFQTQNLSNRARPAKLTVSSPAKNASFGKAFPLWRNQFDRPHTELKPWNFHFFFPLGEPKIVNCKILARTPLDAGPPPPKRGIKFNRENIRPPRQHTFFGGHNWKSK